MFFPVKASRLLHTKIVKLTNHRQRLCRFELLCLLQGFLCHVGFVADGQPFVIPTSYGHDGDVLYIHGSAASRMLRNLDQGLPVCVTVTLLDGLVLVWLRKDRRFAFAARGRCRRCWNGDAPGVRQSAHAAAFAGRHHAMRLVLGWLACGVGCLFLVMQSALFLSSRAPCPLSPRAPFPLSS